jgi:hypothetical protein
MDDPHEIERRWKAIQAAKRAKAIRAIPRPLRAPMLTFAVALLEEGA